MNKFKKALFYLYRGITLPIETLFDEYYLADDIPTPKIVGHLKYMPYLSEFGNKKGMKILEIGSREVTGKSNARNNWFPQAEYVGFDYYDGENEEYYDDY